MKPGTDVVAILCVNVLFDLQANHTKGTTIRCGVSRAPGATAQPLLMSRCVHGNERVWCRANACRLLICLSVPIALILFQAFTPYLPVKLTAMLAVNILTCYVSRNLVDILRDVHSPISTQSVTVWISPLACISPGTLAHHPYSSSNSSSWQFAFIQCGWLGLWMMGQAVTMVGWMGKKSQDLFNFRRSGLCPENLQGSLGTLWLCFAHQLTQCIQNEAQKKDSSCMHVEPQGPPGSHDPEPR